MTNAHVVAGVPHPSVEVNGAQLAATTVLFDPERDVAVLYVPGPASSARWPSPRGSASAGDSADRDRLSRRTGPSPPWPPASATASTPAASTSTPRSTVTREIYGLRARCCRAIPADRCSVPTGQVYGVVFAAATDDSDTGYALTAAEVAADAQAGAAATAGVSTRGLRLICGAAIFAGNSLANWLQKQALG